MKTQTIEVEGLPEGWELTRIKLPESSTAHINSSTISCHNFTGALFDLEKIQPRRIVLEETSVSAHENHPQTIDTQIGKIVMYHSKIVREVKETDIHLTNSEPELSLTVDKCMELVKYGMADGDVANEIRFLFVREKS